MAKLRAVGANERPDPYVLAKSISLPDAIATNDTLLILLVQRRECGVAFANAGDNTKPQLNNELNKLHALIKAEEALRRQMKEEETDGAPSADEAWAEEAI